MERTISEPSKKFGSPDDSHNTEIESRKVIDDMASRRSGHVPAPLRKKRNEDLYKQFITPTGDPLKYLHQHSRSRSMSDLDDDRANTDSINQRYKEMEQLKVMLKEEEETWTSKLQNWKTRRRSVTEDVRKRKEQREDIERAREANNNRKSKTYKEILEDKRKREKGTLNIPGSENTDTVTIKEKTSDTQQSDKSSSPENMYRRINLNRQTDNKGLKTMPVIDMRSSALNDDDMQVVVKPVKYTSKVTAVINHVRVPSNHSKSSEDESHSRNSPQPSTVHNYKPGPTLQSNPYTKPESSPTRNASTLPRQNVIEAPITVQSAVTVNASAAPPPKSNVPKVIMRNKNPGYQKERPKSAYSSRDVEQNKSKTLPRNYRDYSTPRPFVAGASNFQKYRKTNFASKRNMFENMGKSEDSAPPSAQDSLSKIQARSTENLYSKPVEKHSVPINKFQPPPDGNNHKTISHSPKKNELPAKGNISAIMASLQESTTPKPKYNGVTPPKLPLVDVPQHKEPEVKKVESNNVTATATLTPRGLDITHGRSSKPTTPRASTSPSNSLFHDMKICINQRPRSEKGFGFTVRGGDNGKPVIVDTVSPGGAADICQLCVSDEIVAINDVPLADCQSQDDIVQLIVSSVITGNLSLDIRRYGKPKKANSLRLHGTKVVMTPGGFVQVRSDKANGANTLPKTAHPNEYQHKFTTNSKDANNNLDLPPPPTSTELEAVTDMRKSATLPARTSQNPYGNMTNPLTGLVNAARDNGPTGYRPVQRPSSGRSAGTSHSSISEVYSNQNLDSDEEQFRQEIYEAQKALEEESNYADMERRRINEENNLKMELLNEQKRLEDEERKREEERRVMMEEARLEDMRIEEELKKIQEQKMNRKRELEMRTSADKSYNSNMPHWLIEEAERRRVAENDGKYRNNPLSYRNTIDDYDDPVDGQDNYNPSHIWNDPSAQATLL